MSRPTPADRLAERLAHLPDGCRAILAALDRAGSRGGGEVLVRLEAGKEGEVEAIEMPHRYSRQALDGGSIIDSAKVRPESCR